jgi:transcriptional regulator with XRE-family HTH domain
MAKEAEELAGQVARLRALRAAKRVTQQDVADAVEVSLRTVQTWEAEVRPADIADRNLKRLAAYYGVTPDFIEYGTGEPAASEVQIGPLELARLRRSLAELEDQVRLLRAETAERDAEVLRQIGQLRPPSR